MELRELPLLGVLEFLGFASWKSRKDNTEWVGICPVHGGKNQTAFSFSESGKFHCFNCGLKGRGAIDIVKAIRKVGYQEAIEFLKSVSIAELPAKERKEESPASTENPIFHSTYDKFKVKSEWLENRGISENTLDYFGVFQYYNPKRISVYSNKIMIPIRRYLDGELVGYLARETTQTQPKYLFPKGVLKSLEVFGSVQLRQRLQSDSVKAVLKVAYLVESPFCVMKYWQMGIPAVSPYGWSVSPQQCDILAQLAKSWVYLPDADKRESVQPVLATLTQQCFVRMPEYPAEDPEHLTLEEIQALT